MHTTRKRPTFQAAATLHIRWMQSARYSASAMNRRQAVLDKLQLYAGPRTNADLTREKLAKWRDRRRGEVCDSTLRMECSHVQSFVDWALERGMLQVGLVALPKSESRILDTAPKADARTWLTDDQVGKILQVTTGDRRGVITLLLGTGLRKGEAAQLLVSWWDADDRVLRIPEYGTRRTKHHGRDLPVGTIVGGILDGFAKDKDPDDTLLLGSGGGSLPKQANDWLKPFGCSPHDLRRWYSQTLLRAGCPHEIRHAMLGHAPSRRDEAYERPDEDDMLGWARQVDESLEALQGVLSDGEV